MTVKRKSPAANGAEVSLQSKFATSIVNGQAESPYKLEVSVPATEDTEPRTFCVSSGKEARSLLILYMKKMGLTRAEALNSFFILSLTQHVFTMRHDWLLEIETERLEPRGYGRYHLVSPVSIRIFKGV